MTAPDPELRRLREAFASRDGGDANGVDSEAVWKAVHGDAEPDEIRVVLDDAALNPDTAEAWRLAVEIKRLREGESVEAAVVPIRISGGRRRILAIAASVVLGVGLATYLVTTSHPKPSLRGRGSTEITSTLRAHGAVPRDSVVLEWSGGEEGDRDTVVVADTSLRVVFRAEKLTTARIRVPPDALATLPQDDEIVWRVERVHPDGTRSTSPTFTLEIE